MPPVADTVAMRDSRPSDELSRACRPAIAPRGTASRGSRRSIRRSPSRRGATTVEMALVLPTFLTFVFGIIQFGHAMWVNNLIRNAVRESARFGSTDGVTTAQVDAAIRELLAGVVDENDLTIEIRDASSYDSQPDQPRDWDTIGDLPEVELLTANPRQLFVVRAAANLEDVALVRLPFVEGIMLCGESFMRHE